MLKPGLEEDTGILRRPALGMWVGTRNSTMCLCTDKQSDVDDNEKSGRKKTFKDLGNGQILDGL